MVYIDEEETEKMLNMFENPEKTLSEVMSIKEIDVRSKKRLSLLSLTEEERQSAMLENPEELEADLEDEMDRFWGLKLNRYEQESEIKFEKIKVLSRFVLKMAVYRFCTIHFPRILEKSGQCVELEVDSLENEMEEWEKQFWTVWVSYSVEVDFIACHSIADRRGDLRYQYSKRSLSLDDTRQVKDIWKHCIMGAFKDIDTVESVKKMRQDCIGEKQSERKETNTKGYKGSAEIEAARKLIDMMEKQLKGELTDEDSVYLKKNVSEWNKSIRDLAEMLNGLV